MDEREIAEIIQRVQGRMAAADAARPGAGMQAGVEPAGEEGPSVRTFGMPGSDEPGDSESESEYDPNY